MIRVTVSLKQSLLNVGENAILRLTNSLGEVVAAALHTSASPLTGREVAFVWQPYPYGYSPYDLFVVLEAWPTENRRYNPNDLEVAKARLLHQITIGPFAKNSVAVVSNLSDSTVYAVGRQEVAAK